MSDAELLMSAMPLVEYVARRGRDGDEEAAALFAAFDLALDRWVLAGIERASKDVTSK